MGTQDNQKPTDEPWFAGGLQFECVPECGGCCTDHGQYAYVYIDLADQRRIARHLKLDLATFRKRYTALDEGHRVVRMDTPDCPFLDGKRCSVYPVRPRQCQTFPFWEENLSSERSWKKLKEFCPGIDRGERHPLRVINDNLGER